MQLPKKNKEKNLISEDSYRREAKCGCPPLQFQNYGIEKGESLGPTAQNQLNT